MWNAGQEWTLRCVVLLPITRKKQVAIGSIIHVAVISQREKGESDETAYPGYCYRAGKNGWLVKRKQQWQRDCPFLSVPMLR